MRIAVRRLALAAAGLAVTLGAAGRAGAGPVTIISNLPGSTDNVSIAISSENSAAAGIILPAGSDYSLDAVDLRLSFPTTASIPIVAIYDNKISGQQIEPGQLLVTLDNPPISIGSDSRDYLFSTPMPFSMHAGTSPSIYWVVVGNGSSYPDSFNWYGSSPGTPFTGIATSAGYRVGPPPPATVFTMFSPSYAVNASSIPEPASFGMLAIGIGGALRLLWRRRAA